MNHEFDRSSSNIFHWTTTLTAFFSPHNNIVESDGVHYKTSQLQKLLKIVRQCLSLNNSYLLLERDYQSHPFHGAFLKKASGTFDMALFILWLCYHSITCDNESLIIAYQDNVVATI